MNKLPVFNWYLELGDVLLTINAKAKNVSLPPQLREEESVNLIVGFKPTPDISADEWGVVAPMRFSGAQYTCKIPWESVMQMSSKDAVISFRDLEKETEFQESDEAQLSSAPDAKDRSHLRLVK